MAARPVAIDPEGLEVRITTMRRRHLRGVLKIENQVYPRPWSLGLFMGELAMRNGRIYLVARVGPNVVGYAGLLFSGPDGHITTIAVDPAWHRLGLGPRLLLGVRRRAPRPARAPAGPRRPPAARAEPPGHRARRPEPHARGPREQRRRAVDVPTVRVCTGRDPQGLLRGDRRGRDRHVGARHRLGRARRAPRWDRSVDPRP